MTKQEQRRSERIEHIKELKESLKMNALKDNKIIASVVSISNSGMSRNVKFAYINKNGYIYDLTYRICKILGYKYNSNGSARIQGCGMDVIFNTLYNINAYAESYGIIKQSKNKSKHDLYYNGIVNTQYERF